MKETMDCIEKIEKCENYQSTPEESKSIPVKYHHCNKFRYKFLFLKIQNIRNTTEEMN